MTKIQEIFLTLDEEGKIDSKILNTKQRKYSRISKNVKQASLE